jgi:predicted membrane-bound spermidine synthase
MTPTRLIALAIAFCTFAFAMVIGWIGLGPTPLDDLASRVTERSLGAFGIFFFTVFVFAVRDLRTVALVLASGLLSGATHTLLGGPPDQAAMSIRAWVFGLGMWLGAASLVALAWRARRSADLHERSSARAALIGYLFIVVCSICPASYLNATILLHPTAFDGVLYRFDATLGFQASAVAARAAAAAPPTLAVLDVVYDYVGLWFAAVFGLTLRRRADPPVDLLYVWVLCGLGLVAYQFFPASGPAYAFGNAFPNALPAADQVLGEAGLVTPAPRNAMPSLHTAWVIALWAYSRLLGVKWVERGCLAVLALTLAATLAKGEHYLIDLVVALPFAAALLAASLRAVPWHDSGKRGIVLAGLGVWLAWIVALRFGLALFESVPGLSWLAVIATLYHGALLHGRFFALARGVPRAAEPTAVHAEPRAAPVGMRTVTLLFFASGFTALVYEVVFSKSLALVFGSMATATYTVLATYMGGMALGAWIGGRIAAKRADPLLIYAVCEAVIGLYCAATPLLFALVKGLYLPIAAGLPPDAPALVPLRVALGAAVLLVPTVLMGMTLPALARFFEPAATSMGRAIASLYGANTLGAAFGALLAGYAILPALGLTRSVAFAALASLLVAVLALKVRRQALAAAGPSPSPSAAYAAPAAPAPSTSQRDLLVLALAALVVTGLVTLALEVLYMHLLAIVAGNSVYAFSLMLFTFLLGLGGGAELARWLLHLRQPLALTIGWLQIGIACVALFGVLQWDRIPVHFGSYADYPMQIGFGAREAIRALVCFAAMFPPALLIGALYPLTIELATRSSRSAAVSVVGRAAALNTVGNIAGVLLGGFVLLPLLGSVSAVQLLAGVAALLGIVCLWAAGERRSWRAWAPLGVLIIAAAVQPRGLDYTALASGANVYFQGQDWGEIIDRAESADGGFTAVALRRDAGGELRTLLTNGKFQGNNARGGEMKAQAGFALAPLLHMPHRERALVIGYGTGGTAHVLHAAGFKELDIVELSADIVRLADRRFPDVNHGVTARPGVQTFITDGRNFLLLQPRQYQLISMEISSIWFAGAANLYNREFYRLAKSRLASAGVLQQWIQLHHIRAQDLLYVLGSVRSEFRFVWVYLIGGQGIIVASNDPAASPHSRHVLSLRERPGLKDILALYDGHVEELAESVIIDPRGVDLFLGSLGVPAQTWIATDDNLVLEYGTPKGNALDGAASMKHNIATLQRFQSREMARVP